MKIQYRLLLGFFLLIGIGFYYLISWVIDDLRPRYLEAVEEALVDEANVLAEYVVINSKAGEIEISKLKQVFENVNRRVFEAKIYKLKKNMVDLRVYVTDTNGMVIYDSDNGKDEGLDYSQWKDVYRTLKGEYGARASDRVVEDPSTHALHVAAPIIYKNRMVGVLAVAKPTTNINFFLNTAKPKIMIAGTIAAISILLLSFVLSIWITGPIKKLTTYARKIRDGSQATVPKIKGGELGDLTLAFEEMREALEGKKYVEQYVQTLTHELKSPLSGIKGASELLQENMPEHKRQQFLENILRDTKRIQDVVDRMLQLASLESKKRLEEYREFDITDVIKEIIESLIPQFKIKNVSLVFSNDNGFAVLGDKFLIRQAVVNLLQNALDFSPEKSEVKIILKSNGTQGEVIIEDEGSGIPDYALGKIFEKFFSLPRPGSKLRSTGLGLNFIRQVMELHSGKIKIENKDTGGVRATLIFPN